MKLSIILATLNRADFLPACLESYKNLKTDKELIVVDGGSTDGSLEILRSHATFLISETDTSVYNAWNKGLLKASGDWILFLNSDDELVSKNIDSIFSTIPNNFQSIISFNVKISEVKDQFKKIKINSPKLHYREIISEPIYFNAYAFHRRVVLRVGNFCELFERCSDQIFLWSCIWQGHEVLHFNSIGYSYLSHPSSLTLNGKTNLFEEELKVAEFVREAAVTREEKSAAQKWADWEFISSRHPQKWIRLVKRTFTIKTTSQQVYSLRRKMQKILLTNKQSFPQTSHQKA